MRISELIADLARAQAEHGDIDVTMLRGYDPWEVDAAGLEFHESNGECPETDRDVDRPRSKRDELRNGIA